MRTLKTLKSILAVVVAGVGCGEDPAQMPQTPNEGETERACTIEVCDGRDNDCDGEVDENLASSPTECGVGVCASTGERRCVGGAWADSCTPGIPAPSDTICDGLDGDCDGLVDEDYTDTPTTCGVGVCAGNAGELLCIGGVQTDTCDPFDGATAEMCDGEDNDCDGSTDEGVLNACGGCAALAHALGDACDGSDADLCADDAYECAGSAAVSCSLSTDTLEIYGDGVDNDCDDEIDEDLRRSSGTVYLAGIASFDVCELNGGARVIVDGELTLICRTLFIDEGASIRADAVGDEGLCTGGNGAGGGGSASGGGAGGGCYASSGGSGGYGQWIAVATPGAGGTATYGTVSSAEVYSGSRGGDGGGPPHFPYEPGTYSWGALGGGVISISVTEEATIAGIISANGGNGDQRGWNICDDGAGGGGSGGTVLMDAPLLTVESTARIAADGGVGGKGGSGCGPASHGGGGGGGSGGRVKIATDLAVLDGTSYDAVATFLENASSAEIITASGGAGGPAGGSTASAGSPGDAGTIAELAP